MRVWFAFAAALLAVALAIGGCDILAALRGGEGLACATDAACPTGLVCLAGKCAAAELDGAVLDRAAFDGAALDQAGVDRSTLDRSVPDRTASDGALVDGGTVDRTLADSAASDHAATDSAASDHAVADSAARDQTPADSRAADRTPADRGAADQTPADRDSGAGDAAGGWWNPNFAERRRVTVVNSGPALVQFNVTLSVFYDSDMRPDFGDLRLVDDSGALLDHYRASFTSGASASYWVELPAIPQGSSGFWLYYGNPNALTASNGSATFPFHDDFEDNVLDSLRWQVVENTDGLGSALERNQQLELTQTEPNRVIAIDSAVFPVRINSVQGVSLAYRVVTRLIPGMCRTQTPSAYLLGTSGAPFVQLEYRGWTGDVVSINSLGPADLLGRTSAQLAEIVASGRIQVRSDEYTVIWFETGNSAPSDAGLAYFSRTTPTGLFSGVANARVRLRLFVGGDTACQQTSAIEVVMVRTIADVEPSTSIGAPEPQP